ncbi:MAG: DUF362 domain-containing protein [Spirochaetales bacterium]|nr:DUF362 domain-containing protein [Spirochaetales bacterium]
MKPPPVSVVDAGRYDPLVIGPAIQKALDALDIRIPNHSTVLIKPNIMAQNRPGQHTVTHYTIIDALCRMCADNGCTIQIGESIGFFQKKLTRKGFLTSHIRSVAERYGAELVPFDEEPLKKISIKGIANNLAFTELYIPRRVLEAEMVINACKLKTHGGALRFSGAVKNIFGCLPGGYKQRLHKFAGYDLGLCELFIVLHKIIKPALHVMDAVVGLDGGPSAIGRPTPIGVLLASPNPAALDVVASGIIGYRPEEIGILVKAKEMGMIENFDTIKVIGKPPSVPFKRLRRGPLEREKQKEGFFIKHTYVFPRIIKSRCTDCRECVSFCPAGAISNAGHSTYHVDYEKCLFCYYCFSRCPEKAITFRAKPMNRLVRFLWALLRL